MSTIDAAPRFSVTLDVDLREQLQAEADRNHRTLSAQAALCIERDLAHVHAHRERRSSGPGALPVAFDPEYLG